MTSIDQPDRAPRSGTGAGARTPADAAGGRSASVRVPVHCDGPVPALTLPQAHYAVQLHLRCRAERCTVRAAAIAVLQASGDYVLSQAVPPWP